MRIISDAPRLAPADALDKRLTHAPLFTRVKSRQLRALLEEAVRRMSGLGEDAESRYQQALSALRESGGEAVAALGEELDALDEDRPVNRWAVAQLLNDLQDPRALDALNRIISSPMPAERSPDPHGSTAARELVVRTTAVEAVARLAAGGSDEARDALLKYARHSVRSVKIAAALAYLEQAGARGRKELRKRMAKSDHWILDIRRVHPREVPPLEGHRFLPPKSPPEASTAPSPAPGGRPTPGRPDGSARGAKSKTKALPSPTDRRAKPAASAKRSRRRKSKKG